MRKFTHTNFFEDNFQPPWNRLPFLNLSSNILSGVYTLLDVIDGLEHDLQFSSCLDDARATLVAAVIDHVEGQVELGWYFLVSIRILLVVLILNFEQHKSIFFILN